MPNLETPKTPKEIDVFNRFSKLNKMKSILIAVIIVLVSFFAVYFFAKSIMTYTIKFETYGGTVYGEEIGEYKYKFLQRTSVPTGLQKPGYYVAGFYTDKNFKHEYKFGRPIWKSRTIHIDWQEGYAVQLNFVEGEDSDDRIVQDKTGINESYLKIYHEQYVKPGSTYSLPLVFNNIEGNIHKGEQLLWYDNPQGEGKPYETKEFEVSQNIQIYGRWFDTQESKFDVSEDGTLNRYLGKCANIVLPNNIIQIKEIPIDYFCSVEWDPSYVVDGRYYSAFDKVLTKLERVYLGENIEKLGECAFSSCNYLKLVDFWTTSKLEKIGAYAFAYCGELRSIDLPLTTDEIGRRAFYNCGKLESITGTECITKIGDSAFTNNYKLKTINLPTLKSIGRQAFSACVRLDAVYLGNKNVVYTTVEVPADNIFVSASSDFKIYVPAELVETYKSSFPWKVYINHIEAMPSE